jgi:hypothetical protein
LEHSSSRRIRPEAIRFWVAPLALVFCATGCKDANDPDTVASGFVDAYYIEFDHARAKTFTYGGALRRIEEEAKLVDFARKKTAIQEAKARVYYGDPERRAIGDDKVHYRYVLDVRRGPERFETPTVILVAKRDGEWRVIQFHEGGAPRPGVGDRRGDVATSTRTGAP